jgi:hypothetical protein
MSRLPQLHRDLREAGYVTDVLEYDSYLSLWRKLGSGREARAAAA